MTIALDRARRRGQVAPGLGRRCGRGVARGRREGDARSCAPGGSALDAVCATVVALEDNPIYNAGTGAVLNFDGFCELDACVMESARRAGRRRRGAAAREEPDPRRAQGDGGDRPRDAGRRGRAALRARDGLRRPRSRHARSPRRLAGQARAIGRGPRRAALKMRRFLKDHPEYAGGTVGAAAVDAHGVLAAATSTGRRHAEARGPRGRLADCRSGQLRLARTWPPRPPAPASS